MVKVIVLNDDDYQTLLSELQSLYNYHWNDDNIHADNCGSKVVGLIEQNTFTSGNKILEILE